MTDFDIAISPFTLSNIPWVKLPGDAGAGWDAYMGFADEIEKMFPNEESYDFSGALEYNDGPLEEDDKIILLKCEEVGQRDTSNWVWVVSTSSGKTWRVTAGCDFTGWDCQSWADWVLI